MRITPFYVAIFALLFFGLSVRTLRLRRKLRIPVGDGGNVQMLRAMRVHSNFAEYVPITLLLTVLLEWDGAPPAFVHASCLVLLLGRLSHAYGVGNVAEDYRYRVFGMAATLIALLGSAVLVLARYFW